MVAIHFINNPNNYPVINHIDEDKSDNYFENLEWCTQKQNTQYSIDSGKNKVIYASKMICVYDIDDNFIKEFKSRISASKWHKISDRMIKKYIDGSKDPKGYVWKHRNRKNNLIME